MIGGVDDWASINFTPNGSHCLKCFPFIVCSKTGFLNKVKLIPRNKESLLCIYT